MRIGMDIQGLRWRAGIYYYLWNLLDWMCRLEHPHHITLFLYGHPWMDEADKRRQMRDTFSTADLRYVWDGLPLKLLSHRFGDDPTHAPYLVRQIDRRCIFPLWKTLFAHDSPLVAWLWRWTSPAKRVDLFHHHTGLLFPPNAQTNVMTIHDLVVHRFPQYHVSKVIEDFEEAFAHADQMDLILTVSEHTRREVVEVLGIPEENIRVTPEAAHAQYRPMEDPEPVQAVLAKYDLTGRSYILHIGTLEPRKNLGRLVQAFHRLKQEEPALDHSLVLVGARGWMFEPVFETIRQLHLESQVRWLGYVPFEDLPALLNGADVFVYPSLYEGFGLPPLEAMSCGTPVITSRTSSLPEVVGDAGVLIDPCDVEELAEAMRRVLTDRSLQATLREKGLRRAQMFSWERTARLTLDAYEEAWARSQSNGRKGRPRRCANTKCHQRNHKWVVERWTRHVLGTDPTEV